jgi:5-(aminomethyl)-3-furanmethanol phosphate kinase
LIPLVVLKVGGSLFDWPDLPERLRALPKIVPETRLVLVPGGGRFADAIRDYDAIHHIGEERCHWLALKTLRLQADVLEWMLPEWQRVEAVRECDSKSILDPHSFALSDEANAERLPHLWEVTSDSIALRVAQVLKASRLILLKSTDRPEGIPWRQASERGLVDTYFPVLLERAPMPVEWWNLRGRVFASSGDQSCSV